MTKRVITIFICLILLIGLARTSLQAQAGYVTYSKKITNHIETNTGTIYACGCRIQTLYGNADNPTVPYNSGGYTGTLYKTSAVKIDSDSGTGSCKKHGVQTWFSNTWKGYYSGTVYKTVWEDDPVGTLTIQDITPTSYTLSKPGTATVTVKNTGNASKSGKVTFTAPDGTQAKSISLSAGASTSVSFTFLAPASGSFTLTASADNTVNKACNVTGSAYVPPADSSNGEDTISWSENWSHQDEYIFYENGSPVTKYYTCMHAYTYKAVLSVSMTLTPSTLKSGYGFVVNAKGTVSTTQIAHGGGCSASAYATRANYIQPKPPETAKITVGWTVTQTMKDKTVKTQPNVINLGLLSSTATVNTFQAPQNPISETLERKIYTNVSLAGTAAAPRSHNVKVQFTDGGISSKSLTFNKSLTQQIIINGSMYDDDYTGGAK